MTGCVSGTVIALWRYPIKSMQGEELQASEVSERGLLGDRAYAIVDRETGKVASAKHPAKWSRLLACRAAFVENPRRDAALPAVQITLPDGTSVRSDQTNIDQILSDALGRDVRLISTAPADAERENYFNDQDGVVHADIVNTGPLAVAAPPGTFFDYAALHLVTTATLEHMHELYAAGRFEIQRFRPNIVVATPDTEHGFVENRWLGHALSVGQDLRLRMIDPTPRCVVTTLAQGGLPHDPGILRTAARHNPVASATFAPGAMFPAVVGVYGSVLQGHTIQRGDHLRLE